MKVVVLVVLQGARGAEGDNVHEQRKQRRRMDHFAQLQQKCNSGANSDDPATSTNNESDVVWTTLLNYNKNATAAPAATTQAQHRKCGLDRAVAALERNE